MSMPENKIKEPKAFRDEYAKEQGYECLEDFIAKYILFTTKDDLDEFLDNMMNSYTQSVLDNLLPSEEEWEYKIQYIHSMTEDYLNSFGVDGWELCSIRNEHYIFKRKKSQQNLKN